MTVQEARHPFTSADVRRLFEKYGNVKNIRNFHHFDNRKFIEFYDERDCKAAFNALDGTQFRGGILSIRYSWDYPRDMRLRTDRFGQAASSRRSFIPKKKQDQREESVRTLKKKRLAVDRTICTHSLASNFTGKELTTIDSRELMTKQPKLSNEKRITDKALVPKSKEQSLPKFPDIKTKSNNAVTISDTAQTNSLPMSTLTHSKAPTKINDGETKGGLLMAQMRALLATLQVTLRHVLFYSLYLATKPV